MSQYVEDFVQGIAVQREEVLRAFVAKYGFEPDRVVQIVEYYPNGARWYLRRMTDEEMQQASMDGASL